MRFNFTVLFCMSLLTLEAQTGWTEKTGIPVSRNQAVAFAINDDIYVGTGLIGTKATNDFWKYNPGNDTWTEIDSMPTGGRRGAFAFVISGKAYIGGGVDENWVKDNELWEYNPDQSIWTKKASIPSGLNYDYETIDGFSIGSYGYFIVPYSNPNFYMYDPIDDTWSVKATYPGQKAANQITFVINNKAYVGSGASATTYTQTLWEYDPRTDKWVQKADVPGLPRRGAVAFTIGNYGYIGLGRNRTNFQLDFWEYDGITNSWARIDSCFTPEDYALGIGTNAKGYIGIGYQFGSDSGWWEYTHKTSGIGSIALVQDFQLINNPSNEMLLLKAEMPLEGLYSIYSLSGSKQKTGRIANNSISVNDLQPGMYILHFQIGQRYVSRKFLKF